MSQQRIRQLESELRMLRKAERKKKSKRLGHVQRKGSYFKDDHEYLVGVKAKFWRRLEIYRRAGGDVALINGIDGDFETVEDLQPGNCEGCAETHPVGWAEGEWHHNVKSKGGRRCDCKNCGLWVCRAWHLAFHNRNTKWTKR
jgi:hypothetical protein